MKYFFFGHTIEPKFTEDLIYFINDTTGNLEIGLSSNGGNVGLALFLLNMFNRNKERIHLVSAGIIYSSAFDLWVGFRGYKSVLAGSMGMTHMTKTRIRITEGGTYLPEDEEVLQNSLSFAEITKDITFPVMTAKQIKTYEEGKDVYFTCDNLRRIASKQNKSFKCKKPG